MNVRVLLGCSQISAFLPLQTPQHGTKLYEWTLYSGNFSFGK